MDRRNFLFWLGCGAALLCVSVTLVATTPTWIEKYQRVTIHGLGPGKSETVVVQFSAGPGDYAEVSSNADSYGLIVGSEIDTDGNVVITVHNPLSQPVSASLSFTVRLHKM
ncbi:MAG: hypothetical protein V3R51_01475 [Gammaproteobacteria bacterium]